MNAEQAWLTGSRRTSQPRKAPRPVARLTMPAELTGAAAELWRAVVPKLCQAGVLTAADVPALQDMCVCWQRIQECERALDRDGVVIEGYRGSQVRHPATVIVKGYRESFAKYLQKFGLQPMDRKRLPEPESEPVDLVRELYRAAEFEVDPREALREAIA